MKKTLITLATLFVIPFALADATPPTSTTPGPTGPGPRGPQVEMMARMLDLSPAQKQQLEASFAKQQERRQAMWEQHQAEIKQILTPEQYGKWSDLRQFRQERMNRGGMGRGMGPGAGMGMGPGMGMGMGPCMGAGPVGPR